MSTVVIAGAPAHVVGQGADRAVMVLHELFGLNDDIRRIADRFADNGYLAVAPDLYASRGHRPLCILRVMRDLSRGGGQALDQIESTRQWVVDRGISPDRIGVSGFCLGGGFTVLAAGQGNYAVAAPFYGDVPRSKRKVAGLCPTVASFGSEDGAFAHGAERLQAHLERLEQAHDVKTYEGVGHSFMSEQPRWARPFNGMPPMHVGYDEEAAEDAWKRVLGFFDTHLVG